MSNTPLFCKSLIAWLCASLFASICYASATFQVTYADQSNIGFNDSTIVTPVGGNTATTLGEQRKAALNYTLNILSKALSSGVPITITAKFSSLGGTANSATLASTGPNTIHYDFTGAPMKNTYYPAALANKLAGRDLNPNNTDVYANFNLDVDGDLVLGTHHWYYGFDGKPSNDDIDFVGVALHELLHGMGFLSLVNLTTGRLFHDRSDIYSHFLDVSNASPSSFEEMTDAQRADAVKATDLLHWIGPATEANANILSAGVTQSRVHLYTPDPIEVGSSVSHLSDKIRPHQLMEPAYVEIHHDLGIAAAILSDIGWGNVVDTPSDNNDTTNNLNGNNADNNTPNNSTNNSHPVTNNTAGKAGGSISWLNLGLGFIFLLRRQSLYKIVK